MNHKDCPPNCPLLDQGPLGIPQMLADLKHEVERLKAFRWQIMGAMIAINVIAPVLWFVLIEALKLKLP